MIQGKHPGASSSTDSPAGTSFYLSHQDIRQGQKTCPISSVSLWRGFNEEHPFVGLSQCLQLPAKAA